MDRGGTKSLRKKDGSKTIAGLVVVYVVIQTWIRMTAHYLGENTWKLMIFCSVPD